MKLVLMSTSNYEIGLCQTCRNVRGVSSERGSMFYLCRLAERDPRFPKYPRLPVLVCTGYVPADDLDSSKEKPLRPG